MAAVHSAIEERLARLAPDQRAAATAPPGPILCIAPAGSGKTTTLVARIGWLVATGSPPDRICALTFNRRAAEELDGRLATALDPLGVAPGTVRVRTFHALGLEILGDAGVALSPADRDALLLDVVPEADAVERRRLDTAFSRLKLELRVTADEVAEDADAGPVARAFVAYERMLEASGQVDFDDLVVRSLALLECDAGLLDRWRTACSDLLVDETQDVDRSQLELALLLAAPANRIFLVGDDDQSIYGWRLADVRRVLGLAARLPGLRRVDLVTNYRCPAPVVERAVRLVEHNRERFAKRIVARPAAPGRLVLGPDGSDETVRLARAMATWPDDGTTRAVLARTNRALLPAVAVCLEVRLSFRAPELPLLLESEELDGLLDRLATRPSEARLLPVVATLGETETARALLAWATPYPTIGAFVAAVRERRDRLAALRRDDAPLSLATAHGTKGLEFDHVIVLADGFPSLRAVAESPEPGRAMEEERRLAYVAWTRARLSLTLVFDPALPSPFLHEAFEPAELRYTPSGSA